MEFLAATKEGIIIYDMNSLSGGAEEGSWKDGRCIDPQCAGTKVQVVAKLSSPDNAFGHEWSADGKYLASVSDDGIRVYDADKKYKLHAALEKVAPDVGGRAGGVRNCRFSAQKTFIVNYEKWDPLYPVNVHVWGLAGENLGKRLYSCTLKGYTSGALPVELITWTPDEKVCLELSPGTGIVAREGSLEKIEDDVRIGVIPEKNASMFVMSPTEQKGNFYAAVFIPEKEGGQVARVAIYHLDNLSKPTIEVHLPAKVKDVVIRWNFDGSALLILANSDVDESGASYFGTTYLYWLKPDSKVPTQIYGSKDGQVQDIAWSPTANEFMVIVGFQPATIALHSGVTGKQTTMLGNSRRNTLKYNPHGRFVAVGGFGTLAGDLDFYDRAEGNTVSSLRAALTVECTWSPDGRHLLCATIAPRMNEGNQISIFKYTGELVLKLDYVPEVIEARHEDTGAGARTKTQALLFWSSWRPLCGGPWEDRPASPARAGTKRVKGLPSGAAAAPPATGTGAAYRPGGMAGGGAGGLVAAMMRGEVTVPTDREDGDRWKVGEAKPLEEWEIRKMEKQRKKEMEEKEAAEKESVKQAIKGIEQAEKDKKKQLKELKAQLEALEPLKEKDWDELTEEDDKLLETEVEIREKIVALEKELKITS